jgi:hypothetical protein
MDTQATVHHWRVAHRVQQGSKADRRGSERMRATRRSWLGLIGAQIAMER